MGLPVGLGGKAGLAAGGGTVPSAISTETSAEPRGPLDLVGGWAFIPHAVTGCTALGHGTSLGSRQSPIRSSRFEITASSTRGVGGP